ncbi:MAG: hypothetical protein FWF10_00380 [Clostridiales bacterium]|nr:hypothetical protein [Clostridiales bacterium]
MRQSVIRIPAVKQALSLPDSAFIDALARRCKVVPAQICNLKILRQSVDARDKNDIFLMTESEFTCDEKTAQKLLADKTLQAKLVKEEKRDPLCPGNETPRGRVVVAGLGPGGLFAAYLLAKMGYAPLVLERGRPVAERVADVESFWRGGALQDESNVAFGEGGAGTFSDGKLTTRIKDARAEDVLDILVACGAPADIRIRAKPHIGTDKLREVVPALRREIARLGGEIRFSAKLSDIFVQDGELRAVEILQNGGTERVECAALLLATGQAARDTYRMLFNRGVQMSPKAFALGVRAEHPQTWLDAAQYGSFAGHPRLGAAEYRLTGQGAGRGVYSFCMCPGGQVVAAVSAQGQLVVNGMSNRARDGQNANAALVVQITPADFAEPNNPLSGLAFCEHWENIAYKAGGNNHFAPAQRMEDFLAGRKSRGFGSIAPSYAPGVNPCNLWDCLPPFAAQALAEALPGFARQIRANGLNFAMPDAVLTAIESRTSAPLRIDRLPNGQSTSTRNLYPVGEGAGYAGGIVSAAVDGLRAAEQIISKFASSMR